MSQYKYKYKYTSGPVMCIGADTPPFPVDVIYLQHAAHQKTRATIEA